jgi:hypothetical protein
VHACHALRRAEHDCAPSQCAAVRKWAKATGARRSRACQRQRCVRDEIHLGVTRHLLSKRRETASACSRTAQSSEARDTLNTPLSRWPRVNLACGAPRGRGRVRRPRACHAVPHQTREACATRAVASLRCPPAQRRERRGSAVRPARARASSARQRATAAALAPPAPRPEVSTPERRPPVRAPRIQPTRNRWGSEGERGEWRCV